ncbi:SsgA family sporulation/cell division regulator [Streptomyces lunaelactis]|uniref:SsgA family sporulation/cell division regulator n=1 Tax=Streptomyces lunaelactis TaxID=1535768 RepID=UPI00158508D2|nr:SsgA family sporulation/cell division regulator [Streptomyces lunaelactis]NUL02555.1 SsgA family sporulation/cell division regulator [Streptomyces lunaelactis]
MDFDLNPARSETDDFDTLLAASSLGAPRIRAVSAHTPSGIRQLLESRLQDDQSPAATARQPLPAAPVATSCQVTERAAEAAHPPVSLAVLGEMRVGKSLLLNALLGVDMRAVFDQAASRAPLAGAEDRGDSVLMVLPQTCTPDSLVPAFMSALRDPRTWPEQTAWPGKTGTLGASGTLTQRLRVAVAHVVLTHPGDNPAVLLRDVPGLGSPPWEPTSPAVAAATLDSHRPASRRALELSAPWRLMPSCDAYDHLVSPLQPHRQIWHHACLWCAHELSRERRDPLRSVGQWWDLLQVCGSLRPSASDLVPVWQMVDGTPARLLPAEFMHIQDSGPLTPAQPSLCLPLRHLHPPPTAAQRSAAALSAVDARRRRLIVVTHGTQPLWQLLQRSDVVPLRPHATRSGRLDLPDSGLPAAGATTLPGDDPWPPLACTVQSGEGVTTVRAQTQLELLDDGHLRPRLVRTTFTYRSDDPYAVRVTFGERVGTQVEWTFARELLIEGLRRSSGTGDVTVHRAETPPGQEGPTSVRITLSSPKGRAILAMRPSDLEIFLDQTRAVVVYGSEHLHMRIPWERLTEELWWHPNSHR